MLRAGCALVTTRARPTGPFANGTDQVLDAGDQVLDAGDQVLDAGATIQARQQAPGFCWQNAEPRPAPPLLGPELVFVPPAPDPVLPPGGLVPPVAGPVGAAGAGAGAADDPPDELAGATEDAGALAEALLVAGAEAVVVAPAVVVVDLVALAGAAALATPVVGTVSGGAPLVFAAVDDPPPPQALSPPQAASMARMAVERLIGVGGTTRSPAAPCACRSADSR